MSFQAVLVIWAGRDMGRVGDRRIVHALKFLGASTSLMRTKEEGILFDYLLQTAPTFDDADSTALPVLSSSVHRWHALDLWESVLARWSLCSDADTAGEICAGIRTFGLDAVNEWYGSVHPSRRPSSTIRSVIDRFADIEYDSARFGLIRALEAYDQPTIVPQLRELLSSLKLYALKDLRGPREDEDTMKTLTDLALECGGVQFLEKTCVRLRSSGLALTKLHSVLPQIRRKTGLKFLTAYAVFLHRYDADEDSRRKLRGIVSQLLMRILDEINFFPDASTSGTSMRPKSVPHAAFSFIKSCLDCAEPSIADQALQRLTDRKGVCTEEASVRAVSVLLPLIPLLQKDLSTRSPPPALPLDRLCKTAVALALKSNVARHGRLKKKDLDVLFAVAFQSNGTLLEMCVLHAYNPCL